MANKIRLFSACKFDVSEKDHFGVVSGYIPYYQEGVEGTQYQFSDSIIIRFKAGAFDKAIASGGTINLYYAHDSSTIAASTANDTLRFTPLANEMKYTASLDLSDPDASRIYNKIKNGLIDGTSFGGTIDEETWTDEGDFAINTITEFGMYEVSPCPNGTAAFSGSRVVIRAESEQLQKSYEEYESQKISDRIAALTHR